MPPYCPVQPRSQRAFREDAEACQSNDTSLINPGLILRLDRAMAAPIAHFEDDWPVLGDLKMVSDQRLLLLHKGRVSATAAGEAAAAAPRLLLDKEDILLELQDGSFSPEDTGAFRSMEDLVNGFDEKLSACFRDFNAETESIAPVDEITEESLLERDQ